MNMFMAAEERNPIFAVQIRDVTSRNDMVAHILALTLYNVSMIFLGRNSWSIKTHHGFDRFAFAICCKDMRLYCYEQTFTVLFHEEDKTIKTNRIDISSPECKNYLIRMSISEMNSSFFCSSLGRVSPL